MTARKHLQIEQPDEERRAVFDLKHQRDIIQKNMLMTMVKKGVTNLKSPR